ncbi:glycosyltransferase [Varunaivibrio sulfuroxidans]|uniref:Glycosyltransferase involved in cell wall biosynthesis n=1 Tax=Varunaivibrio sulfuroxidans TaxID=1773489 RepID=A0A4R3JD37_9PROT|nr:glycosyltransferase [Varunaivibrio sulfuroxidans]TCS62610.1 glycosyltransferase involved in cell wall biosynthesis [Varunaivibrio sulfuroxidans]WES30722.1 glycosyltransferase [Varunaivibrio sulfuroxidans]
MRLLQAMAGAHSGGAEGFFERLVIALNKRGVAQRVVIRTDDARAARLAEGGVSALQLPFSGVFDGTTRRALKREIAAFRPDVVMTWMNRATAKMPSSTKAHPFVFTARLGGYYDLKYYRRCDHLVGNTHDLVEYMTRSGWPAGRAHYLPNFVAGDGAPPVSHSALGVPAGAPLVFGLGRLHENKAFDVLIRAVARLDGVHLVIGGEGPLRGELEKLARDLGVAGRVHMPGWRDDVAALLAAADVFVCSSRHEPLGNVVIEGWAHRAPVVAAASAGPAALIEDGESGLLVAIDDDDAMGRAIARVMTDDALRAKMVARGHDAYRENFTEEVVVARYMDFFETLAGGKNRREAF